MATLPPYALYDSMSDAVATIHAAKETIALLLDLIRDIDGSDLLGHTITCQASTETRCICPHGPLQDRMNEAQS